MTTPGSDDFALLDSWRAGDKVAGNELFQRHFTSIYRFFRNKVGTAADDLTQRTFLACVEGRDSIRKESSFRTFLFGVARNVLLKHLRREHRGEVVLETFSVADFAGSPAHHAVERQEQELILLALQRLALAYQIPLELHYWEDMSVAEIAEVLEVSPGTIKSRLSRGRDRLETQLRRMKASREILESAVSDLDKWARSLNKVTPHRDVDK